MAKAKEWKEGEMILTFKLTKIDTTYLPLLAEWLQTGEVNFDTREALNFEYLLLKTPKVSTWSEDDLKMKFISPILELSNLMDGQNFTSFFEKKLDAQVDDYSLSVKADFVVAKGLLDYMERPFFHFQEYKPQKNPTGDPMAQLLEAFLIGQAKNNDDKPLYGCEVIGAIWRFVVMQGRTYCVSRMYDSTTKEGLLQIIAILRKFKEILETRLLN